MELWKEDAGIWTVEGYLRRLNARMRAHLKNNETLVETQKLTLTEEVTKYREPLVKLRAGARELEDFEDDALLDIREEVNVCDFLVDEAQDESWKIIQTKETLLFSVGQTTEKIFGTTQIAEIKGTNRPNTVEWANQNAKNIKDLPDFDGRDRLVENLERRSGAMKENLDALTATEGSYDEKSRELRKLVNTLRLEVTKSYGNLLSVFPKRFVESLFAVNQRRKTPKKNEE